MIGTQAQGVTIRAVVYPECICGHPFAAHAIAGCGGYTPVRPVRDLGLRAYQTPRGWPLYRRVLCEALWIAERSVKVLRERIEPSAL